MINVVPVRNPEMSAINVLNMAKDNIKTQNLIAVDSGVKQIHSVITALQKNNNKVNKKIICLLDQALEEVSLQNLDGVTAHLDGAIKLLNHK